MPRSQSTMSALPSRAMYSADSSHSSIVADMPRFSSTGVPVRPTSRSRSKFCMLRAPSWIMSATSSTSSSCRGSMTSVTIGRPVSSRASARISRPGLPRPWKA